MGTPDPNAFDTFDDILDFAIEREDAANAFYTRLAGEARNPAMKAAFLEFAAEERGHKLRLERVKVDPSMVTQRERVLDLRLADYLVAGEATGDMPYEDVLIVAMNREKAAYRLYLDLSEATTDPKLQTMFRSLSQEEAKHKLRFELEYDEHVMRDN